MGWYGIYNLKYKGEDKEKFVKVAKIVIPSFKERFDVKDNDLKCKRLLSWYTSEVDIGEILGFLNDGDSVELTIDGETHPIIKRGEAEKANLPYYEEGELDELLWGNRPDYSNKKKNKNDKVELKFENVLITNKGGEIEIENKFRDVDRYIYDNLGNNDLLYYGIKYDNVKDLEDQFSAWADVVVGDKEMADIACKHITNSFKGIGQEVIEKSDLSDLVANLKNAIASPERLEEFLSGYKKEVVEEDKKENKSFQTDWIDYEAEFDDINW